MAKPKEPVIVGSFVAVTEKENPIAHQAWAEWRRQEFACYFVPKGYSVPSMFPPSTQAGADAYAEQLKSIREACGGGVGGWKSIPKHPRPWGQNVSQ